MVWPTLGSRMAEEQNRMVIYVDSVGDGKQKV